MDHITLEEIKQQVNADELIDDDALLTRLGETAEAVVIRHTRRSESELMELGGGDFPIDLKHAMLLLVSHWYNQRENVAATEMRAVPYTLQYLVDPFRKLTL